MSSVHESEHALRASALSPWEAVGSSIAQIGPAIEMLFIIGAIGAIAGLGAPFIVLVAGVAYIFHVNSTAEFSKEIPSAGGYTAYLKASGGRPLGASSAVLFMVGWAGIGAGFVLLMSWWVQTSLQGLVSITIPWPVILFVLTSVLTALLVRGIVVSTNVAIAMFFFELVIVGVGLVLIVGRSAHYITFAAFEPSNILGGFGSIGIAFPLAIFMFIGASNSAPLAEEVKRPRVTVPIAVFGATALAAILFVVGSGVLDAGFHNSAAAMGKFAIPFISAPGIRGTVLVKFIYLAGVSSVCAIFLAGFNAASRVLFSLSRDAFLPKSLSRINRFGVPAVAVIALSASTTIIGVLVGWLVGVVNGFSDLISPGTDVYVVLLIAVNLALIAYTLKDRSGRRSAARTVAVRVVAPLIGSVVLAYPLWESIKPGASGAAGWDWLVCVVGIALACGAYLWHRRKAPAGSRAGAESPAVDS